MFEVDPRIGAAGAAVRAGQTAAHNARIAESERRIAQRYQDSMESWREYARKLEKEVAELKWKLIMAQGDAAGMKAWRDEFKKAHPDSSVSKQTGQRYKDGSPKSQGRLAWEKEFDRILREARISDPEQYRD